MPYRSKVQLRTLRRAAGLLQEDLAHLLGFKHLSSVTRFEHAQREPDLRTAFACEVALGAPASTLFSGAFEDVKRAVIARARERLDTLSREAHRAHHDVRASQRLMHLVSLIESPRTLFDV